MRPAGQSKQIATNAAAKAHLICMAESRGSGEGIERGWKRRQLRNLPNANTQRKFSVCFNQCVKNYATE